MNEIRERVEKLKQDRSAHLLLAVEAHETLQRAKDTYEKVIMACHELGLGNTQIARQLGVSETSVRLYIKRRLDREAVQ